MQTCDKIPFSFVILSSTAQQPLNKQMNMPQQAHPPMNQQFRKNQNKFSEFNSNKMGNDNFVSNNRQNSVQDDPEKCSIFVRGLPKNASFGDFELRRAFVKFGEIASGK